MIKGCLLYLWQLPQHLLGLILVWVYGNKSIKGKPNLLRKIKYKEKDVFFYEEFPGGISLGNYILLDYNRSDFNNKLIRQSLKDSIQHEFGHSVQSERSGLFYLLSFGLISLINNIVCRIKEKLKIRYNYYACFVERQADKLGGVKRK